MPPPHPSIPLSLAKVELRFDEVQLQRILAQSKDNAAAIADAMRAAAAQSKENAATIASGLHTIAAAISGLLVTPETPQITGGRVVVKQ